MSGQKHMGGVSKAGWGKMRENEESKIEVEKGRRIDKQCEQKAATRPCP
jgi:hypothetical protein